MAGDAGELTVEQEAWMARALDFEGEGEAPVEEASNKVAHIAALRQLGALLQGLKAKADPRLKDLVALLAQAVAAVKIGAEGAGELVEALQSALADDDAAQAETEAAEKARLAEQRVIAMQGLAALNDPRVGEDRDKIQNDLLDQADAAVAGNDMGTAEALLRQVGPQAAVVSRVMERFAASDQALVRGRDAVARVAGEFVRPDREAIERDFIATAAAAASRRDFDGANGLLALVDPACALAQGIATRHAAYEQELLVAQAALATLTEAVIAHDKAAIELDLLDAAAAEAAARRHDAADLLLAQVAARVATAKVLAQKAAAFATKLAETRVRIALIVDPVAGTEKAAANQICVDAEARAALPAREYDAALAKLATAGPSCDLAELRIRRYAAGLTQAKKSIKVANDHFEEWRVWSNWSIVTHSDDAPGITDLLALISIENVTAAQTHATAGRFVDAMRLLEATAARLPPVNTAIGVFSTAVHHCKIQKVEHDASRLVVPVTEITAAYDKLVTLYYHGAFTLAKVGDYASALALVLGWATPREALNALGGKWTAAIAAHATLAAEPGITVQADQLKVQLIDAALREIAGGALEQARARLELAVARCPRLLAYGVALKDAEEAMGAETMLAADAAQIRKDLIAAAATSAASYDYDTAIALLSLVPGETVSAATAETTSTLARAARDQARPTLDAIATDPQAAVAAVRKLVTELEGHAMAARPPMQEALTNMNKAITNAETLIAAFDLDPALTGLRSVLNQTASLAETLGTMARTVDRAAGLRLAVDAIDAEADVEKAKIRADFLDKADLELGVPDPAKAMALLTLANAQCIVAKRLADAALAYRAELLVAQTDLTTLVSPFLDVDKAAIQLLMIDAAGVAATARDMQAARDFLVPVAGACATAREILAEKLRQDDPLKLTLEAHLQEVDNYLHLCRQYNLPAFQFDPRRVDLKTNHLDAAAARIASRGTGAPALAAMKGVTALLTKGRDGADVLRFDTYVYLYASHYKSKASAAIDALKQHPGHAAVAAEIAGFDVQLANASVFVVAAQYSASYTICAAIQAGCTSITVLAAAAGKHAIDLHNAGARLALCQLKADNLAPKSPLIVARLQAVRTEVQKAGQALGDSRDYKAAEDLLKTMDERCKAVEDQINAEELYRLALDVTVLELAKLAQPSVAAEALRLNTVYLNPAKAAAMRLDHAAAMALLSKVAAEVAAALAIGTCGAQAQAARGAVAGDLAGPLPGAIQAVDGLLAPLLIHAKAAVITDLTDAIAAVVTAMRLNPPPADAAAQLAQAADRCTAAWLAAERHAAFDKALKAANDAVTLLADPLVADDSFAIATQQLDPAKAATAGPGRDFATAWAKLDEATAAVDAARQVLAREAALKLSLAAASTALGNLGDLAAPENTTIATEANTIKTDKIDRARTLAALPGRDHAAAQALLEGVAAACQELALRKKAAAGAAPTEPEIEALIKESGGTAQLDKIVGGLPDDTARGVMETLISLRFGLNSFKNLNSDGSAKDLTEGKAVSLKKLYVLLSRVPDSHTRQNPSLAELERYGGEATLPENVQRGSNFSGGDKRVVLSCGRAKDAQAHPLEMVSLALPDVEPDCEMVADSNVSPPPTYFDWTTLHEIGHAIDDKKSFMQAKAGDANFGGWQSHGADVMPAARAIAKACNFNGISGEAYLASLLLGGQPAVPVGPSTRSDWEACRVAAVAWCEDIRVGQELWANGGRSAARVADGRVHHEAYAGTWVSYELAARKKGLTGYQFRAPGEWLSELYAAFHCGKLKGSHPSASWLATL